MKFVIVNQVLDGGNLVKIRVNPRLVEEVAPANYLSATGDDLAGGRLTFQTGRSIVVFESPDALASALSRGYDQ